MALDLISGVFVLTESEDGRQFVAEPYNPQVHVKYPRWNIRDWAEYKYRSLRKEAMEWKLAINTIKVNTQRSCGKFTIAVNYQLLFKFLYEVNAAEFLEETKDERILQMQYVAQGIRPFLEKAYRVEAVLKWLDCKFPNVIPEEFTTAPPEVRDVAILLANYMGGVDEMPGELRKQEFGLRMLDRYIEAEREAEKTAKDRIEPVNITDGYNAGWLAPTGEYYGMNGEVANFLHNKLANRLLDAKIIPWAGAFQDGGKRMGNPDRWLEENGWVKIHGDLIQYEGYTKYVYKKGAPIPLTEKQIDAIYAYGTHCYGGVLSFGDPGNRVRVAQFRSTEPLMLHKYFER